MQQVRGGAGGIGGGVSDVLPCVECRRRWYRGRLCRVHFADFLAWLTVLGLEGEFWRGRGRLAMVTRYRVNAEDLLESWEELVAA